MTITTPNEANSHYNASATEVELATHLMQETSTMTYEQALRIVRNYVVPQS